MKKLSTFLATSVVTLAAAATANAGLGDFTGISIGLGVGGVGAKYDATTPTRNAATFGAVANNANDPVSGLAYNSAYEMGNLGVIGGIFAGYTKDFGQFTLGLEGGFSLHNDQAKVPHAAVGAVAPANLDAINAGDFSVRGKYTFDIRVRGGYHLSKETQVYLVTGYRNTRFEAKHDGSRVSDRQHLNGFNIGGGVETLLTDHIVLGAEASYTTYGSKDVRRGGYTIAKIKPMTLEARGRVAYKFN